MRVLAFRRGPAGEAAGTRTSPANGGRGRTLPTATGRARITAAAALRHVVSRGALIRASGRLEPSSTASLTKKWLTTRKPSSFTNGVAEVRACAHCPIFPGGTSCCLRPAERSGGAVSPVPMWPVSTSQSGCLIVAMAGPLPHQLTLIRGCCGLLPRTRRPSSAINL